MEWALSKTRNKYGEHSHHVWDGPYQVVVFRRRFGWSFTVRALLSNDDWVQIASGTQAYWLSPELCKLAALARLTDLKEMTNILEDA